MALDRVAARCKTLTARGTVSTHPALLRHLILELSPLSTSGRLLSLCAHTCTRERFTLAAGDQCMISRLLALHWKQDISASCSARSPPPPDVQHTPQLIQRGTKCAAVIYSHSVTADPDHPSAHADAADAAGRPLQPHKATVLWYRSAHVTVETALLQGPVPRPQLAVNWLEVVSIR